METVPVTLLIIPDTVENVSIVCIPYNTLLQARKQEQRKHSVGYGYTPVYSLNVDFCLNILMLQPVGEPI